MRTPKEITATVRIVGARHLKRGEIAVLAQKLASLIQQETGLNIGLNSVTVLQPRPRARRPVIPK